VQCRVQTSCLLLLHPRERKGISSGGYDWCSRSNLTISSLDSSCGAVLTLRYWVLVSNLEGDALTQIWTSLENNPPWKQIPASACGPEGARPAAGGFSQLHRGVILTHCATRPRPPRVFSVVLGCSYSHGKCDRDRVPHSRENVRERMCNGGTAAAHAKCPRALAGGCVGGWRNASAE
jgi:hypothetical protein